MTEMTTMLIDYMIKRGRVYMDVRDLLGLLSEHPDQQIDKDELKKALVGWHDKVVKMNGG